MVGGALSTRIRKDPREKGEEHGSQEEDLKPKVTKMKKSKAIKDTMTTTIMDMCEYLLAEILAWLPVFTLLRCKALLLCCFSYNTATCSKPFTQYSVSPPALIGSSNGNIQFCLPHLIGSSNGLVCLFERGKRVIWNPATRETKVMPPCSVQKSTAQAAAFGFDAINNDYKVCVIHLFGNDYYPEPVRFKLEVYSLRTDSWNLITGSDELQVDLFYIDERVGVYNNGVFSWVAFAHKKDPRSEYGISWKHSIISFDINTQVITTTPLPSDIGVHEPMLYYNYIGALDGVVSVLK
ncbi:F-box/kelch-repeat protein At3g06240-like [Ziziphus jujuba]|uniref:F-box/kelch-repeat protein At3g06240-like n=1 Tax=Ziziphus jujuba TaxID=326968 RepID=A0ABM3ZUG9_ZIZJJ|nr:F-box/kelch-repeat protein At3g06240-like [Ziziphus jujuba]